MENETIHVAPKEEKKILPFKMKDGFELASTAPPTIPALVSGLLVEVGTSILSADPKCGKSTFCRQLLVDVAEGRDFLGMPTLCGDAVYLYLEGPVGAVQQHFQKLGLTNQRGKIHVIDENMSKSKEDSFKRLRENLKILPNVRLVVVDPLSKLFRLKDSTATDEVTPAMEQLEKFAKENKLHVMALMHEKKEKSQNSRFHNQLGSTGFRGGSDSNISLGMQGKDRIISAEQRWGQELEPTFLKFDEARLASSLASSVEAVEEEQRGKKDLKTVERIEKEIQYALLDKTLATGEIVEAVTGKRTTILDVLEQMVSRKRLVKSGDGTKTSAYVYRAVEIQDEERTEVAV